MADLEQRLADALREAADGAPLAFGLADGARRRLRARRRNRLAAVGVVAVLAVGVPAGALALRGTQDHDRAPAGPTASGPVSTPAATGYRWESWHGVSVQVPDSWGYGFLDQWCADGASPTPRVERSDEVSEEIGCSKPNESYGLAFSVATKPGLDWPVAEQINDGYPPHAFVGTRDVAGVFVEVATPSAALSQHILDSVVVDARVMPDGCPATTDADDASLRARQSLVSVCGYDSSGMLSHSVTLADADSASAAAAVAAAPPLTQCYVPDDDPVVLILSDKLDVEVDLSAHCLFQHGDISARTLTDGVRKWASAVPAEPTVDFQ